MNCWLFEPSLMGVEFLYLELDRAVAQSVIVT